MFITSAVIESYCNNSIISSTATIINNKYAITSSYILSNDQTTTTNFPFVIGLNKADYPPTSNSAFSVIYFNEKQEKLVRNVKLLATFGCKHIYQSTEEHLCNWNIGEDESKPFKAILATFPIFTINQKENDLNDLFEELYKLWKGIQRSFSIADKIYIKSCPFGNPHMINSHSEGVISNIFGINNCLMVTDCSTVQRCEGGPVFLKNESNLLGIVLSSLNWLKGEWLGLTLVTTFHSMLGELFDKETISCDIKNDYNKSVVQIISGNHLGSGILIDKHLGIFLTNAHVVENAHNTITIKWKCIHLKGVVLYKPINKEMLDLAVIKCYDELNLAKVQRSDMSAVKVFMGKLEIGEKVFAVGYPNLGSSATVTSGVISHISDSYLSASCAVLAGTSGGPLLNGKGCLIGIITGNAKHCETSAIFPRINKSIRISIFWHIINKFLTNKDFKILQQLNIYENQEGSIWSSISSKL